jgi:large subunit ribosomal protein L17
MRHKKHRHEMGLKKEHRMAVEASLAQELIEHGAIHTTLAKAKALRPFIEKIITIARKGHGLEQKAEKLHYFRLVLSRIRSPRLTKKLFDERIEAFVNRPGGYTRIYKLGARGQTDAAEMAKIELIAADDAGYKKARRGASPRRKATTPGAKAESAQTDATAA